MNRVVLTPADVLRWVLILAALAVTLFPFYWMVNTSLKPGPEVFQSPPTFFSSNWSFEAYRVVFETRPIGRYLLNSLVVSVGATALSVVLSALAAYGFTRFFVRGAAAFVLFLLFTKMLPETLLIIPYFQIMASLGLVDTYLALILAYSSFALPFSVWMLIGFFRTIPRDIDEAAIIDGASRLQTFFKVILPLARPGLVAVALFTFIIAWNSYVWALVLTTDANMFVVSVGIANLVGEYRVQWNELMAASVIAALPVMVLYGFLNRHLVSAITAGAVKA
ncbi:MAG: carbohydrate ABC transporter permease [Chelatococcus sp.]|jgi:multiple sugar transport system permease protein|uniref:carbohydrate ABC transporter permease n=1 Tax=Chelatococcus sp. TaxID=1953771 RepID=UPI0025C55D52|nr:carbohydrate ABC transporter permease [Chelatococcus sp.]MBX3538485.1 carbohydrate ABC transporter permease [Chelatococcus sp.]